MAFMVDGIVYERRSDDNDGEGPGDRYHRGFFEIKEDYEGTESEPYTGAAARMQWGSNNESYASNWLSDWISADRMAELKRQQETESISDRFPGTLRAID